MESNSFKWSDGLAVYAAVLSSLIGLVEVFRYLREIRNKLVVRFYPASKAFSHGDGRVGEWTRNFTIRAVNHSITDKFIRGPRLEVDNRKEVLFIANLVNPIAYPVKLTPGEEWETSYDRQSILDELIPYKCKKVRTVIEDRLGNTYKSNWMDVRE